MQRYLITTINLNQDTYNKVHLFSLSKDLTFLADVISAQTQGKLSTDNESSSSDSDDAASICSVSWTFPVTNCLSPLPPSPACLKERKVS